MYKRQPQEYTLSGSPATYVAQGTFQTVTAVSSQVGCNPTGSQVFTLVVPKTAATPTAINVLISAPLCGTLFRWEVDCPAALPSFEGSPLGGIGCDGPTTTYYFARNATGTNPPFTVDTNVFPEIGNFVFTVDDGSVYLNDTSTLQYVIIGNPGPMPNTALGIRNGVVVSSGPCNPT